MQSLYNQYTQVTIRFIEINSIIISLKFSPQQWHNNCIVLIKIDMADQEGLVFK